MSEANYRGTGLSKEECQARVDAAIKHFRLLHPGEPVPSSLTNWVDNIATDEDVRVALERAKLRR